VGDTVNLIARLEAYTKVAYKLILIDETTCQSLSDTIKVEDLGPAEIKGKNQEVKIYSVPVDKRNEPE
jgi:class 3 adenylate cyclase